MHGHGRGHHDQELARRISAPVSGKGVLPKPIDSRVTGLGPKRKQQTVQVRCSHIFTLEQPHCGCNRC